MAKAVLIVNPFASGVTDASLGAVEAALGRYASLETLLTEAPRHGVELARAAAPGCDAVFVYSGDGGFNEVLNGLETDVPVGFIPGGGTSVLPRALGIPRGALAAAERLGASLQSGQTRRISVGRVNGRRFGFTAGLGLDAETVRRFNSLGRRPDGRRPGDARFALTLAAVLRDRRFRYDDVAELDGERVSWAIAANCRTFTYAGRLPLVVAPRARFELGLDVVAPRRVTPLSIPRLAGYLATGSERMRPATILYHHDIDSLELRADRPLPLEADGEDLGDVDHVVFECERNAVRVLV